MGGVGGVGGGGGMFGQGEEADRDVAQTTSKMKREFRFCRRVRAPEDKMTLASEARLPARATGVAGLCEWSLNLSDLHTACILLIWAFL